MSKHAKKLLYGCRIGNLGWVEAALAAGESPDLCNAEGLPGLIVAAGAGHEEICLVLLEAGADASLRDAAMRAAEEAGHDATAQALAAWEPPAAIAGLNLLELTDEFEKAVRKGDVARVREILETGYDHRTILRSGPMETAVRSANLELMELLHEHGAELQTKNRPSTLACVPPTRPELLEKLLAWGADPKHRDHNRRTPLHTAGKWGHDSFAKMLLAAGASLEAQDKDGRTAMDLAILEGKNPDLIRTLAAAGARVSPESTRGLARGVYADRGEEIFEVVADAAPGTLTPDALVAALSSGRVRIAYDLIDRGVRVVDWTARPSDRALVVVASVPDQLGPVGVLHEGESLWHCAFSALFGRPTAVARAVAGDVDVFAFDAPDGGVLYVTASDDEDAQGLLIHTRQPDRALPSLLANIAARTEGFSPEVDESPSLTALRPLPFGQVDVAERGVDLWQLVGLTREEAEVADELGLPTVEAAWLRDGIGRLYLPDRPTSTSLGDIAATLRRALAEQQATSLPPPGLVPAILAGDLYTCSQSELVGHDAHYVLASLADALPHPVQLLGLLLATAEFVSPHRRTAAERALSLPPDHPWAHRCNVESLLLLDALDEDLGGPEYAARRARYEDDPQLAAKTAASRHAALPA